MSSSWSPAGSTSHSDVPNGAESASPYSERAHRLAIACHLQRHDRAGLESAVRSTERLLADLGVEPEDATKMLLRRAGVRLGASPRLDQADRGVVSASRPMGNDR